MEHPSGMAHQPCLDLGMFVGGIVVDDGMDHLACRNGALDLVEKADKFLTSMTRHVLTDINSSSSKAGQSDNFEFCELSNLRHW